MHVGSAPAVDLVPLAFLGFGLCLLYRVTGSLYPCIAAHSLNNSIAYGSLESWTLLQVIALIAGSLLLIGALVLAGKRVGLILIRRSPSAGLVRTGRGRRLSGGLRLVFTAAARRPPPTPLAATRRAAPAPAPRPRPRRRGRRGSR